MNLHRMENSSVPHESTEKSRLEVAVIFSGVREPGSLNHVCERICTDV